MVQTVKSVLVPIEEKKIVLEKPSVLHRIFFSLRVLARLEAWLDVKMSFDDPLFLSWYPLNGPEKYFQAEGNDIFQGNIWIHNHSDLHVWILVTEILH